MKKRVFDVTFATLLTPLALPLMAAIAVGVAATAGRPVIFAQQRRGKNDEIFTIYKFRSMTDARDAEGNLLPDKDRTTRFGRFMRITGLDELPQLFNILKGDMSFVGPRPRSFCAHNNNSIPDTHKNILSIAPGLTGTAQIERIKVRHDLSLQEKLKLDWDYAAQPESLRRDIGVIAKTLPIFLRGNGSDRDRHFRA